MNPQLIVISGSLKGTIFALTEAEVSIGRERSNTVCLNDPSVSRRHCLLKRIGDDSENLSSDIDSQQTTSVTSRWSITDLESFNGTFVNGIPVKEHPLAHGDQIAVGDVVLIFILHELEAESAAAVQLREGDLITRSTVRLRQEDALYLRPDKLIAELPATTRIARDLNTLLRISSTINSIRRLGELQTRLLELIRSVVPAERAAILLVDREPDTFGPVCGWSQLVGSDNSLKVSGTITKQVLLEGIALLSNDLIDNQDYKEVPSLVNPRVCSVLCLPLAAFGKRLGVIYLDTSDPAARFDEGHLQLLTAVAGLASVAFENARHFELLEHENSRLQKEIEIKHEMIGESAPMQTIYKFVGKVARTDSTVLIRGESGTGKELAARAIHLNSSRATKPFVAINCATLSESLLESELFGHEKGAFTGAITQKRGKLEIADGGTLLLDEVGELAMNIQAKLLRVLQAREFERVGGTRPIKVDVRIIGATNRNLEEAIKAGTFRQDLYYRLNVVWTVMPPLRERREDIPLLASYFVATFSRKCKRKVTGISADARSFLVRYDWPGNVRELENAIERAIVLGSTDLILPEDLPDTVVESASVNTPSPTTFREAINESKRSVIVNALKKSNGNFTEAAKLLGMHPNNLHRVIRNLNLKIDPEV
jgi:transcriptional regulator with GAF, ATPase, and Fis domain